MLSSRSQSIFLLTFLLRHKHCASLRRKEASYAKQTCQCSDGTVCATVSTSLFLSSFLLSDAGKCWKDGFSHREMEPHHWKPGVKAGTLTLTHPALLGALLLKETPCRVVLIVVF